MAALCLRCYIVPGSVYSREIFQATGVATMLSTDDTTVCIIHSFIHLSVWAAWGGGSRTHAIGAAVRTERRGAVERYREALAEHVGAGRRAREASAAPERSRGLTLGRPFGALVASSNT